VRADTRPGRHLLTKGKIILLKGQSHETNKIGKSFYN
jgi:hypothetical protein